MPGDVPLTVAKQDAIRKIFADNTSFYNQLVSEEYIEEVVLALTNGRPMEFKDSSTASITEPRTIRIQKLDATLADTSLGMALKAWKVYSAYRKDMYFDHDDGKTMGKYMKK